MAVAQKQARIGEVWNSVSVDTLGGLADQEAPPRPKLAIVGIGAAAAAALLAATLATQGWRQGLLLVVGLALGATLYHARFGFASAFRQLAAVGQGRGLRAHLLMLAAGSILFAGILSFGHGIGGIKVRPETTGTIGVSLILGAFLFGVGMQLGGACASGTLFAIARSPEPPRRARGRRACAVGYARPKAGITRSRAESAESTDPPRRLPHLDPTTGAEHIGPFAALDFAACVDHAGDRSHGQIGQARFIHPLRTRLEVRKPVHEGEHSRPSLGRSRPGTQ